MQRVIIKSEEQRFIAGEVYVPYRLDTWNDFMQPSEIIKAAHYFMEHGFYANVNEEHDQIKKGGCVIVESYIAKDGDPDGFIPGAWVAAGKVLDDEKWEKVKKGEFNGWSMEGVSQKVEHPDMTTLALKTFKTETELSMADNVPEHSHQLLLRFDNGKLSACTTLADGTGHKHEVLRTTGTETVLDHAHRFDVDWLKKTENATWEEITQPVQEIINAKPDWLALVKHGAIRAPFKIVKSETHYQEETLMDRVVQAIKIAKGADLQSFAKIQGLEFLANPRFSTKFVKTMGGIDEHVLIEPADFLEGSLQTEEGPNGLKIVLGTLMKSDNGEAIQIVQPIAKDADQPTTTPSRRYAKRQDVPFALTEALGEDIAWKLWDEADALQALIYGFMSQSQISKEELHGNLLSSTDRFRAFIDSAFGGQESTTKTEETDMTKEEVSAIIKEETPSILDARLKEVLPPMLKTEFDGFKESLTSEIAEIVKGQLPKEEESVETSVAADAQTEELTDIQKLEARIAKNDAVLEKLLSGPTSTPGSRDGEGADGGEEAMQKSEGEPTPFLFGHSNPRVLKVLNG